MFQGHELIRLGTEWVFDLTEFEGYRRVKKGNTENLIKSYSVIRGKDNEIKFEKMTEVPAGILRKTKKVVDNYFKEVGAHGVE